MPLSCFQQRACSIIKTIHCYIAIYFCSHGYFYLWACEKEEKEVSHQIFSHVIEHMEQKPSTTSRWVLLSFYNELQLSIKKKKKNSNHFVGCTLKLLMSQYVSNAFEQGFSIYECFSEFLFTLQEKFHTLKSFTNLYLVFIGCLCGGMEKEWKTGTFIDNSWINVFYMVTWKSRRLSWKSI